MGNQNEWGPQFRRSPSNVALEVANELTPRPSDRDLLDDRIRIIADGVHAIHEAEVIVSEAVKTDGNPGEDR